MTRPRRALALRLYLLGLAQLVVLAGAVSGAGWLIRGMPPDEPDGSPGPPAMNGFPPNAIPAGARRHPPAEPQGHPPGPPHHGHVPFGPLFTFFVSGVFIVGIGSLWTARWIIGPVERLSQTARQLGAGDLSARSGLDRDDELGDLGRAFDEMAGRVQQLLLSEKELLANVSHELRTPLARIRVALDIAGEADGEGGRASLNGIGEDLTELDSLIEDILTTTRLAVVDGTTGAQTFELHSEDLGPEVLARRAADRFRARHPRRTLDVKSDADLPIVHVDPVLLRRAIDNVLENADKYSPDPKAAIMLRTVRAGAGVAFEVQDRGLGIPAGDLPHVFTPFFRGERSRSRGTGGVGLGLTLTRRIALAHGGSVDVASDVGRGTTVRITVPGVA